MLLTAERLASQIEVNQRILSIIERPDLGPCSSVSQVAKDSLDYIWQISKVEDAFAVEIPNADLAGFQTINDISVWLVAHA